MPEAHPLLSVVPLVAIERPACSKCQAQMMLARIMPAFLGTDLHTFECWFAIMSLRPLARMTIGAARSPEHSRRSDCITSSVPDTDPFAPYGQESRHDHGAKEKAEQSE
jgi:hypothetical protein